ncbi:hypothetical protein ABC733_01800 [Mangrovibacter sp. SLW1]
MLAKELMKRNVIFMWVVAIVFVFLLHGAVPFLMMPTLGQAVWSMGFAESFAHGAIFSLHANDFGIPHPAAIAFGLAGVLPASVFIRFGLHPADAYSITADIWLLIAMCSAYKISRSFGAGKSYSLLSAVVWMSSPIIWVHSGYSMLSWGIALLSFYFYTALRLFLIAEETGKISFSSVLLFLFATIISIFMDGYTFMMFAVGASGILFYSLLTKKSTRSTLLRVALPIHICSFALAYALFVIYIGQASFESYPMDFFRGWGVDLTFLIMPTKGILWLADLLKISLHRSDVLYYGDSSVWKTTFVLPVMIIGAVALWNTNKKIKPVLGILVVVLFSFIWLLAHL